MKKDKTIYWITTSVLLGIFLSFPIKIYAQSTSTKTEAKMETITKSDASEQVFIDRFVVPQAAKQEFIDRMNVNRNFLKTLPGFIEDNAYEKGDENGNSLYVTVAVWKNEDAIRKAKEAVQAEYKRQGFDMPGMLKRLNIVIDRGVYKKLAN